MKVAKIPNVRLRAHCALLQYALNLTMVGVKCQISVDCVLYQPINDFVTDPPVTFHNKEINILLLGDESEISTQVAEFSVHLTKHIDEFPKRGSGWAFRNFVRCDV